MDIKKVIEELLAEKAKATNKDNMGAILDKALEALKEIFNTPADDVTAGIINSYKVQLTEKDKQIITLQGELSDARDMAKDAIERFNEGSNAKVSVLETKHDGKTYIINHGVNFSGQNYTASDLRDNSDVTAELIKIGSGAITLKEGK